ncbi:sigma-70 family RNA polymerase sigma factor [candidate division KSB1 bacterium]|nr:sigma-70 family RNA polymerase sigma factor [candidate division KSB1 bacterium]
MSGIESEYLTRIAAGDQTAFQDLVRKYQSMVFNVAYRMLESRHDAEDITQDVFIKAYHSAGSFRHEAKVSTWLYRIAINLSLNVLRKRTRLFFPLDCVSTKESQLNDFPAPSDGEPDAQLMKKEKEESVKKALHALPKKQRTAIILHRYEGLSYKEIAGVMNTSLSAVESLIHRAKLNLRKKLSPLLT